MLMPKKVKHRKVHRGRMKGRAKGGRTFLFGTYALQAVEPAWMTAQQIEAMRVTITRKLRKFGKLFIRVFPHKPITKKPAETRMGKGKGNPEFWASVVKRDRIICEIGEIENDAQAKAILHLASHKLPMKTRIIKRESVPHESH